VRTALIPPKGYEHTADRSDIHLVLPIKDCQNNTAYFNIYKEARHRGHYIILDNGCAEGELVDGNTLLNIAAYIGAHEIVAPDVMGDAAATLEATNEWLDMFSTSVCDYNIMGVLQGNVENDWKYLLRQYVKNDLITAIGIPKVHVSGLQSRARLEIVRFIKHYLPKRFQIHLLGLSGNFPTEIRDLEWPAGVRSMDSTQPYKVAEQQKILTTANAWAKRRPDYFSRQVTVSGNLLDNNIDRFKNWGLFSEGRAPRR